MNANTTDNRKFKKKAVKYLKLNIHAAGYFPCLRAAKCPYFKEFSTIENVLGVILKRNFISF